MDNTKQYRTVDRAAETAAAIRAGEHRLGIDEYALSVLLGVSVSWLRKDRREKRILPFFKLGDRVLYSPERARVALLAVEFGGAVGKRRPGAAAGVLR